MAKEYSRSQTILGLLPISGSIILHDDFSGPLQWTKGVGLGDAIFELSPSISKHGKQSLHLKTRTTDAANGDEVRAVRYLHLLPSKVLSFLSSFRCTDFSKILHIMFSFEWYDGASTHICHLKFSPGTPKWEYYDSATAYQIIAGLGVALYDDAWHNLQLVVNFATDKYISFRLDHLLADLSAIAFYSGAPAADSMLMATIEVKTNSASPAEIFIDDIMINEII